MKNMLNKINDRTEIAEKYGNLENISVKSSKIERERKLQSFKNV